MQDLNTDPHRHCLSDGLGTDHADCYEHAHRYGNADGHFHGHRYFYTDPDTHPDRDRRDSDTLTATHQPAG